MQLIDQGISPQKGSKFLPVPPLSRGPVGLISSISVLMATIHSTVLSMPGGNSTHMDTRKDSKHKKIPWGLLFGLKQSIQDRKICKMQMVSKLMLQFKAITDIVVCLGLARRKNHRGHSYLSLT